jgi:halogenation protein CepH
VLLTGHRQWDLIVIGAGPAGAAAAITARQRGLSTLVLEADRFPRHHIGESLVRLWTVFDALGVLDRMEQTFQHKYGSGRVWGESAVPKWTYFDEHDRRPYSLQVRRSEFDAILADKAVADGADLRFGWRAVEPLDDGPRIIGVRARDEDGGVHDLYARFVIDASGRAGFLAKRMKLRLADLFYPDLSVFAYVVNAHRFPGSQAGSLFIEAVPWGWFWFIPLRDGEVSVGLVCDRDSRSELKRAGPAQYLQAAVRSSTVISDLLRDASITRPATATASGGYSSHAYGGLGWLLAGDSGSFIDPMWATGVASSLRDGIRAASAVHGVIGGTVDEAEAVGFHNRHSVEQADVLHETVRYVYGVNLLHRESAFWQRRHRQLSAGPERLQERGLGWLAKDPAVRYFRSAFMGMGIRAPAVAELDGKLDDLDRRGREADTLFRRPLNQWVPRWTEGWEPRSGVGMDSSGTVRRGVEIGRGDERMFSGDPLTVAALELIDGTRSVADVLHGIGTERRRPVDVIQRTKILAALKLAHAEGAIEEGSQSKSPLRPAGLDS